jgi:hypothetical protein
MKRISYLAAISTVVATDYHSTQLLLEEAIKEQANVRTFRFSMADIQGWDATSYNVAHMTDTSKYLAYELLMQASEWFIVELGFDLKLKKI